MSAAGILAAAREAGLTIATAESLTAGQVASALASVSGASDVLQGGVVAYQNSVKENVLGVDAGLLASAGSVDAGVAEQMAAGARRVLDASIGVATTGAAGPAAHDGKPVGTVFVAVAGPNGTTSREFLFSGDRTAIRNQACTEALGLLAETLAAGSGSVARV